MHKEIIEKKRPLKKMNQLKGLTLEELRELFVSAGEPRYRAEQVFNWMYNNLAEDFEQMNNIPKALRVELAEKFTLRTLDYAGSEISPESGTKKYIFETAEKNKIESVVIPDKEGRVTLCISTQAGCPLDCKFCATGLMGYKKNLTSGEIFDQYLLTSKDYGADKITNIVYMGMGEPLLNFEAARRSLKIFAEELTTGISLKKITVSTAGIAPRIYDLADSALKVKIALSLHSCFEDVRSLIMPINKKYPLAENIKALKYYAKKTGTAISFEYIMLRNINDRDSDLKALIRLCSELPSKVNIIPFNPLKHMNPSGLSAELEPSSEERVNEFVEGLRKKRIRVTVRFTQGRDIAAACGQLAVKY